MPARPRLRVGRRCHLPPPAKSGNRRGLRGRRSGRGPAPYSVMLPSLSVAPASDCSTRANNWAAPLLVGRRRPAPARPPLHGPQFQTHGPPEGVRPAGRCLIPAGRCRSNIETSPWPVPARARPRPRGAGRWRVRGGGVYPCLHSPSPRRSARVILREQHRRRALPRARRNLHGRHGGEKLAHCGVRGDAERRHGVGPALGRVGVRVDEAGQRLDGVGGVF